MSTTHDSSLQPSLPIEIHAATRESHTNLNQLITSRLSLCLPPLATSPAFYAGGIAVIAQIYLVFEKAWEEQMENSRNEERLQELLKQIYIPRLLRSERLRQDTTLLHAKLRDSSWNPGPDEFLGHWRTEVERSVDLHPHHILAYAWVMYMALFNGGRWIRGQLLSAGPDFWATSHTGSTDPSTTRIECLSFWDFDGEFDGEDIKDDFKARFTLAADRLTESERQDVVKEADRIFNICSKMVALLDDNVPDTPMQPLASFLPIKLTPAANTATAQSAIYGVWSRLSGMLSSFVSKQPGLPSLVREEVSTP